MQKNLRRMPSMEVKSRLGRKSRRQSSQTQEFSIQFKESDYQSCEEFMQRFKIQGTLGEGGQAQVKEAVDTETGEAVALKILKKSKMTVRGLDAAYLEHSLMRNIKHKNILHVRGYFEDTKNIVIVYDMMSSDLRQMLVEIEGQLTEKSIRNIFKQMLMSIQFCHENNIVHRDVKLENFLVDLDEDQNIVIKLADFGLAYHHQDPEDKLTAMCGSLIAVAPEMLLNDTYSNKVDVWALGVVLHELLSTQLPFYSENDEKYKKNIVHQELKMDDPEDWGDISSKAQDLVAKLLEKNPNNRINVGEALRHPWFDNKLFITKQDSFNSNNTIEQSDCDSPTTTGDCDSPTTTAFTSE